MKISEIFGVQDFFVVVCEFFYNNINTDDKDPKTILEIIRYNLDEVHIQIVNESIVLNTKYIKEVLKISIESYKRGILATKKLETDLLMRLSHCDQIFEAIKIGGIKENSLNYVIIFSKNKKEVKEVIKKIKNEIKKFEMLSNKKDREHLYENKSKMHVKNTKEILQYFVERASLITEK